LTVQGESFNYTVSFSGRPSINLDLDVTIGATNSSTYRTTLSWSLYLDPDANNTYNPYGTGTYYVDVNANGSAAASSGSRAFDFRGALLTNKAIVSGSTTIDRGGPGNYTTSIYAEFSGGSSTLGSASISRSLELPYITPPIPQYSYSYNSDGGSSTPSGGTANGGSPGITTGSPGSKTGYNFNYWIAYNSSSYSFLGTVGAGSNWILDQNTIFIASWSIQTFTASFFSDGVLSSTQTINYGNSPTMPSISKSGYSLSGWSSGGTTYAVGSPGPSMPPDRSFSAVWQALTPGFTDETISGTVVINQNVNTMADSGFSATNATSYSISYAGSELNPTTWLSIDNSGNLSGSTNTAGTYTFRVNATGPGGTGSSNIATIIVRYPGKRLNSVLAPTQFTTAKRYAPGESGSNAQGWKPLTSMKRWDGSQWVNLSN
jgi:hypothetical protein